MYLSITNIFIKIYDFEHDDDNHEIITIDR